MKSNLEFITHDPPVQTYSGVFGIDIKVMTILWKGLPFLYVWYMENTSRGRALHVLDDDEDDDADVDAASGEQPREDLLTSLIPELKSCWGMATSLTKIKELALQAEKDIVRLCYSMQTRKASNSN